MSGRNAPPDGVERPQRGTADLMEETIRILRSEIAGYCAFLSAIAEEAGGELRITDNQINGINSRIDRITIRRDEEGACFIISVKPKA